VHLDPLDRAGLCFAQQCRQRQLREIGIGRGAEEGDDDRDDDQGADADQNDSRSE